MTTDCVDVDQRTWLDEVLHVRPIDTLYVLEEGPLPPSLGPPSLLCDCENAPGLHVHTIVLERHPTASEASLAVWQRTARPATEEEAAQWAEHELWMAQRRRSHAA